MPGRAQGGPRASPRGVSWCGPSKCPRMSGEAELQGCFEMGKICGRRGQWCWGFAACLESQLSITFPLGSVWSRSSSVQWGMSSLTFGTVWPLCTSKGMNSPAVCVCSLSTRANVTAPLYPLWMCTPGHIFWKFGTCLLIGFELHIPCVKNLSDNCSPQGPEIPC